MRCGGVPSRPVRPRSFAVGDQTVDRQNRQRERKREESRPRTAAQSSVDRTDSATSLDRDGADREQRRIDADDVIALCPECNGGDEERRRTQSRQSANRASAAMRNGAIDRRPARPARRKRIRVERVCSSAKASRIAREIAILERQPVCKGGTMRRIAAQRPRRTAIRAAACHARFGASSSSVTTERAERVRRTQDARAAVVASKPATTPATGKQHRVLRVRAERDGDAEREPPARCLRSTGARTIRIDEIDRERPEERLEGASSSACCRAADRPASAASRRRRASARSDPPPSSRGEPHRKIDGQRGGQNRQARAARRAISRGRGEPRRDAPPAAADRRSPTRDASSRR